MVHVGACVEYGQTQVQSGHMLNVNRCMIGIYAPRLRGKDSNPFYTIFLSIVDIIAYTEYEVDCILNTGGEGNKGEYLVLWEGYEEATWEPSIILKNGPLRLVAHIIGICGIILYLAVRAVIGLQTLSGWIPWRRVRSFSFLTRTLKRFPKDLKICSVLSRHYRTMSSACSRTHDRQFGYLLSDFRQL
jgi:hypothetical protein